MQRRSALPTRGSTALAVSTGAVATIPILVGRRALLAGVAVLCVVLPAAIYYSSSDFGGDASNPVFNSPLTNSNAVLARELASGRGMSFPLEPYADLPPDIATALVPRDAAFTQGQVVPKGFLPEILMLAGLLRLGLDAAIWVPALLGGVATLGVFLITRFLADTGALARRPVSGILAGGIAAAVFAAHPSQWIVNSRPFAVSDGMSLVCLVYGMAAALPLFDRSSSSSRRASLVGALFAVAVAFRYPNALVVAVPLAVMLFCRRDVRLVAIMLWPAAVVVLVIAMLQFLVYGSPFVTGHQLSVSGLQGAVPLSSAGFFAFNTEAFARYVEYYLTTWELVGAALVGIAVAVAGYRWGSPAFRAYAASAAGMFFVLMFIYGGQEVHGIQGFTVNTSFTRYLLPGIALLVPLATCGALLVIRLAAERRVAFGYIAVLGVTGALSWLLGASISMALDDNGGVLHRREIIERMDVTRGQILAATDERALIITRLQDKLLFPERSTLVATRLIGDAEVIEKGANVTWAFVPDIERLADIATRVDLTRYRLFLLNDGVVKGQEIAAFSERLARDGIVLTPVEAVSAAALYEFVRSGERPGLD